MRPRDAHSQAMDSEPEPKRLRVASGVAATRGTRATGATAGTAAGADTDGVITLQSMSMPVSPPRRRRLRVDEQAAVVAEMAVGNGDGDGDGNGKGDGQAPLRSPFQLTAIHDLPPSANVDAVTIRDVFGDPRVVECWEFNYLHDVDFLMAAFDEGARRRGIAVHVVHGFWKHEDGRRLMLEEAARQYQDGSNSNGHNKSTVTLHTAYLPEPFGTHHTKMAVLFRDDATAQVVVHTANLIPQDWGNMTQAVWRSPLLPLVGRGAGGDGGSDGVGDRFKQDLLSYLRAYSGRRAGCQPLIEKLRQHDFSAVRAVLVGSVPGRHEVLHAAEREVHGADGLATQWGWAGLREALRQVPLRPQVTGATMAPATGTTPATAEVVVQVSSIATLGGSDAWLRQTLFAALSGGQRVEDEPQRPQQQEKQEKQDQGQPRRRRPDWPPPPSTLQFRIVFPVADEIRRSLNGYESGVSIHTKIQSAQQQRQLQYMRPMLCHWANDVPSGAPLPGPSVLRRDALRRRAAPHVKTYVRYASDGSIDWALLTSANLSKQAWGEARTPMGTMRIASYELGVLVWPGLLVADATMLPVFGRDMVPPIPSSTPVVPLRIPYSLPLQRYGPQEVPWVGTLPHDEPDWRGMRWEDMD